jgi:uncharacterized protein (DUF849 family)
MRDKVIITCAVTGSGDTVGKHPAIPVTPKEIAEAAIEAGKAGAAVAHIHVRDPKSGKPSRDVALFREVVERIRESASDIVINLSCGAGGRIDPHPDDPRLHGPGSTIAQPADRVRHVTELKPEICSLDVATMNMGEYAFVHVPRHLREMCELMRSAGAKPELEVFDSGHIRLARHLIDEGFVDGTPLFQIVLGVAWGAPQTSETMLFMRDQLPKAANWAAFGISRMEFPMAAQAVLLGGHVRVGLEDNLYVEKGVFGSNAQLVDKAAKIVRLLGPDVATPAEARALLGLRGTQ